MLSDLRKSFSSQQFIIKSFLKLLLDKIDSSSVQFSPREPGLPDLIKLSEHTPICQSPIYWNCVLHGKENNFLAFHTLLLRYLITIFCTKNLKDFIYWVHTLVKSLKYMKCPFFLLSSNLDFSNEPIWQISLKFWGLCGGFFWLCFVWFGGVGFGWVCLFVRSCFGFLFVSFTGVREDEIKHRSQMKHHFHIWLQLPHYFPNKADYSTWLLSY